MNRHAPATFDCLQLGVVVDNRDPDGRGRVKLRLSALDMELWASVVAPSAGPGYGASFVPRLDEIAVVAFVSPDMPVVIGSIWSGADSVPQEAEPQESNYVIRTPAGTVVEFDDNGPRLELRMPGGGRVTLSDGGGGSVEVELGGQNVVVTPADITVHSSGTLTIEAGGTVNVSAPMVKVDAAMSRFSGVVQADTVITNAVVSASYTPGAGNIW
ncbi:phage baseplate assembly protein V [Halomonas sp. BM-2019]|uniref:phage baseplate assembly protein V n=1 Tax=Halomonas sp. BM-2019 TaxID=2811227 RepID=UPI001B3C40A6|nr:MAG: hypothetical protein J5F18_09795 [Halomonas sp. BM-2019]